MTLETDRIRLRGFIDDRANPNTKHRSRVRCECCGGGVRYAGVIETDFVCDLGVIKNPEFDPAKANEFGSMPVWVCANCDDITPRQRRTSGRKRRLNALLAELVERGEG